MEEFFVYALTIEAIIQNVPTKIFIKVDFIVE